MKVYHIILIACLGILITDSAEAKHKNKTYKREKNYSIYDRTQDRLRDDQKRRYDSYLTDDDTDVFVRPEKKDEATTSKTECVNNT